MGSPPTIAIFAASLMGPAQVGARLVEFTLLKRFSPQFSARLATSLHPIGALLLAIFGPAMAVPFVLLHGAGNGLLTIARGTLPLAMCALVFSRRQPAFCKAVHPWSLVWCLIAPGRCLPCCSPAP
jgi:hypothetical protein